MSVFGNSNTFFNQIEKLRLEGKIMQHNQAATLYNENIICFVECDPEVYWDRFYCNDIDVMLIPMLSD